MKKIVINDKKKLEKKLFLYRGILYKNCKFECESDLDVETQNICTALNLKNKKERIEYVYNKCIEKVDNFYSGKNYCDFQNGQCICQRMENSKRSNGCCQICIYQSENGCPTQNLSCKLFYCDEISKKNEMFPLKDLTILKVLGLRRRLIAIDNFFAKKEDVIVDISVGLLTFYAVRALYRILKNMIMVK